MTLPVVLAHLSHQEEGGGTQGAPVVAPLLPPLGLPAPHPPPAPPHHVHALPHGLDPGHQGIIMFTFAT